uniref:Ig-like domain-containing protein n=1 Tax=Mastacembelus armatus TaxID=205130 RepID=A0A3Q3M181_9TELE
STSIISQLFVVSNMVTVTQQHDWPQIFSGETITVRCEIQGAGDTEWDYEWTTTRSITHRTHVNIWTFTASGSSSEDYMCKGRLRGDWHSSTKWSEATTVTVSLPNSVAVTLQPNWPQMFRGEKITVRCEIQGGDTEWEYEWETTSSNKPPNKNEFRISFVSSTHSGNYRCQGRMKNIKYKTTEWSNFINLTVSDNQPKPVLTVSPSWLSPGASVTLNCEVEHPSAGWRFYWYKAVPKLSAGYVCRAGRGDPVFYTQYSELKLVWSPSWSTFFTGEFVTFICHMNEGKDTDWEYKINKDGQEFVQYSSYKSYSLHLLSTNYSGVYQCIGRHNSSQFTKHSNEVTLTVSDVDPAASLTVSPDRVQHFTSDSVSLSCEGNSTEWRVRRFPEDRSLSCPSWTSMTGSTCKISTSQSSAAVYWCESGSGEFSNSVNITFHDADIILVSPVRPVAEGDSVTLGCKLRKDKLVSSVFFYLNDKVIHNNSRGELSISAVSKSDEGFYKCQFSGQESPQSWMSVTVAVSGTSVFPVLLIVGLVCGFILIVLIVLCCYRQSRGKTFFL